MSSSIETMKERVAELGGQIRSIKQGGANSSSSSSGDLESIQAELKDLKTKLAKAEKEHKEEKEKNKIVIKVPKV
jgi:seryl-tRNA synthetase